MTFKEIGRALGISPQKAQKIYERAIKKLSSPKNIKKWQEILDTLRELEKERAIQESDSKTLDSKV